MIISRVFSLALRAGQLISAVIVAGIIGHYLDVLNNAGYWPGSRFIYTEVVAGLGILAALVLLIPFTWSLTAFPFDLVMFLLWIISFALLVDYIAPMNCTWYAAWSPIYPGPNASAQDQCSTWKTALAFIFISALLWLVSAFLAMWVVHRTGRSRDPTVRRRRWYSSHY
ncbi:integral membrane protein [Trichophaea hybrida]|nr:integral membrane protein [Trichophaea hybrida]